MSNKIQNFSIPKIDEDEQDIQDKYASSKDGYLVAISDGVSSSLYPDYWAKLLVTDFCHSPNGCRSNYVKEIHDNYQNWLKPIQEKWHDYFINRVSSPDCPVLEWYPGKKDCGYATFVGIKFEPLQNDPANQKWEAIAVGDSCLFKIENSNNTLKLIPIHKPAKFSRVTESFSSRIDRSSHVPKYYTNTCKKDDIFLLVTDALGEFICEYITDGGSDDLKDIINIKTKFNFVKYINKIRNNNNIRNDDTTLVIIKVFQTKEISNKKDREQVKDKPNLNEDYDMSSPQEVLICLIIIFALLFLLIILSIAWPLVNSNNSTNLNKNRKKSESNGQIVHNNYNEPPKISIKKKTSNPSHTEMWVKIPVSYLSKDKTKIKIPKNSRTVIIGRRSIPADHISQGEPKRYLRSGTYFLSQEKPNLSNVSKKYISVKIRFQDETK